MTDAFEFEKKAKERPCVVGDLWHRDGRHECGKAFEKKEISAYFESVRQNPKKCKIFEKEMLFTQGRRSLIIKSDISW
ncbi:MAG: hypothetical protein E7585_03170 [Ruminococcaceae bacterium]|nr:hypothetical protein [Oscillospiraceae bacterium]